MNLLLPREVILYSKIDDHFPPCDLDDIREIESYQFTTCLGGDFYDALVADLTDVSGATAYDSGTSYNQGDMVIYDGLYYTADQNSPAEPPTQWTLVDKFQTTCNNDLWCNGLARYLSLVVVRETIPLIATQIGSKGIVKKKGEDFEPASEKAISRLQSSIESKINRSWILLDKYMRDNNDDDCYDLYVDNTGCDDCDKDNFYAFDIG